MITWFKSLTLIDLIMEYKVKPFILVWFSLVSFY